MEGDVNTLSLGKSILVPSVQELAKDCLNEIPQRYVRCDEDPPILEDENSNVHNFQVPIINMEALISEDGEELEKLYGACQEWGCFQLVNHGANSSLVDKFKLKTHDFFNLPLQEKKRYWQTPTDMEGFGQAFVVSDDQKLDWADMFYLTTLPKELRKPHLFPKLPLFYRETLEDYSAEMQKLARKILHYMAKALNIIDSEQGENVFGEGHQSIRMNYYPPCPEPEKAMGLSPHTDATMLITILLQLNEIEGLQVNKDSKWVGIKPLPHAFIVNIGDAMEIMTNGIYKSVLHRAVVNATKERLTVVTFHSPTFDRELGPIPCLISPNTPATFRRVSMLDYWKGFLLRPLDGKRYLDSVRIVDDNENSRCNKP